MKFTTFLPVFLLLAAAPTKAHLETSTLDLANAMRHAGMVAIEADSNDPIGDIAHLEHLLQSSKVAEGAMLFQTLHRLREALATQVTKASDAHTPVTITAMDAVLLSRVLLKRLG